MMKCPLKFSRYEFEGGTDCIGVECGFFGSVCDMDMSVSVQKCPNDEPPESDVVAILRKAAKCTNANTSVGDVLRYNVPGNEPSAWQTEEDACMALADIVERDYVSREKYENTVKMCNGMHSDVMHVAELQEQVDVLTVEYDELREELADSISAYELLDRVNDELQAERDEWKAKAEHDDAHSKAQSKTEPPLTEQSESLSDEADSRENGWYLRYDGYMTSKSNYLRISGFKAARALDNHQNLVFVKFMGGKEADCRVYAPKLDVCEKLHDSSGETQKPRSKEANPENMSDSDGENLHVEHDSREKLEDDVGFIVKEGFVTYKSIIGWLDRQAAIVEREWQESNDRLIDTMRTTSEQYREKITELTAELEARDKYPDGFVPHSEMMERVGELTEQLEAAYAKNRALKAHISKMQQGRHGWHVKGVELQRQVDELTAQLRASNAERARLRECLGTATDHAHDLLTLVDESGNAHDRDEGLA